MTVPAFPDDRDVAADSFAPIFSNVAPQAVMAAIGASADIALLIEGGVVQNAAVCGEDLRRDGFADAWCGKRWSDTVTVESRPKIAELLANDVEGASAWRQVNHPSRSGADVPNQLYDHSDRTRPGRRCGWARFARRSVFAAEACRGSSRT